MLPLHYKTLGEPWKESNLQYLLKIKMCYRYTTRFGGGVLGGFEPPFFLSKGERDTITLQDSCLTRLNVLQDSYVLQDYKGVFMCYLIHV